MKALLIIDMQKISFTSKTPRLNANSVIEHINLLSEKFRSKNWPVIVVQHDGSVQDFCKHGTPEWEVLDSIHVKSSDILLSKTANDAFYKTDLTQLLRKRKVNEVLITGCATDFCVDSTVKSSLINDFNTIVIADAHTTADRPHVSAVNIVAHYNWLWSEMTPTLGKLKVVPFAEFISSLS